MEVYSGWNSFLLKYGGEFIYLFFHIAPHVKSECTGIYSVRFYHCKQSSCCGLQKHRNQSPVFSTKMNLP